jgi:hypothetical protein
MRPRAKRRTRYVALVIDQFVVDQGEPREFTHRARFVYYSGIDRNSTSTLCELVPT